jgi:hypothetical protein
VSGDSIAAARLLRIGEIILAVARQMVEDRGVARLALLDDGSPEAGLVAHLLAPLGAGLVRVRANDGQVDSLLHSAGFAGDGQEPRVEAHRFLVRLLADAIPTSALTKTDLLLGGEMPPEAFLPLGDLYASEVVALAGEWRGTPNARRLAEAAGGIERLDGALRAYLDGRDARALGKLPAGPAAEVRAALRRGSWSRSHPRLVPKLGTRTIGIDLFE